MFSCVFQMPAPFHLPAAFCIKHCMIISVFPFYVKTMTDVMIMMWKNVECLVACTWVVVVDDGDVIVMHNQISD